MRGVVSNLIVFMVVEAVGSNGKRNASRGAADHRRWDLVMNLNISNEA